MIVTLTPNPAVDKAIIVSKITPDQVHRVQESYLDPAGKGINVTRLVDRLGWPTIAFGFLAGEIGRLVAQALDEEGVQSHFVRVPGQTRLNVTIFEEATERGTSFYDRGPQVDPERLAKLEDAIRPWVDACRVLVLAGSLPPGVPDDVYVRFIGLAHSVEVKSILDTHGAPLRLGLQARPYLIKPNLAEAEELLGRPLPDLPSALQAAREIQAMGVEVVVISLGAKGAVCVSRERAWLAVPPPVERKSTVGSGDSMVAGLALGIARDQSIVEGLRLGTAAGAATAMAPGTALGAPEDVARLLPLVRIEEIK